jgi:hypothetical protein
VSVRGVAIMEGMTRFLCAWLGHWWLSENNLTPGHPVDPHTHGTLLCPRCGERLEDWRGWV